ncbi:uncharacterized protein [Procambarus clarkii]|uniref:uncharacterized protein isoform X2 n=1 Tax=Procambarus clarkii TaxID=6728 RepID=UPI0037420D89
MNPLGVLPVAAFASTPFLSSVYLQETASGHTVRSLFWAGIPEGSVPLQELFEGSTGADGGDQPCHGRGQYSSACNYHLRRQRPPRSERAGRAAGQQSDGGTAGGVAAPTGGWGHSLTVW